MDALRRSVEEERRPAAASLAREDTGSAKGKATTKPVKSTVKKKKSAG